MSPFQCGFPIAGSKRQDSHSHWLCLHGTYNHIKRKTISHCRLSTLPEWVAGPLSPSAEPWLLWSWRTYVYFRHCSFFVLDEVPVPVPSPAAVLGGTVHSACWPHGLPGYRGCNFPCSVRIPISWCISHCLWGVWWTSPSMWISPVRLCLSVCHHLSQHCCCLQAMLSPGTASKLVSSSTAWQAALGSVGQERHCFNERSFISVLAGQSFSLHTSPK